jgi:hypothetical protein
VKQDHRPRDARAAGWAPRESATGPLPERRVLFIAPARAALTSTVAVPILLLAIGTVLVQGHVTVRMVAGRALSSRGLILPVR